MCGICGVAALRGPLPPDVRAAVPAMAAAIRHRGPDGQGVFEDEFVALGHRRLSIIDVSGGAQPISNEDETIWIVFNGEIYNHVPLRKRLLSHGHRFHTNSDTETIVHAFEEYGANCVSHLEGMFAFALYDCRTRQLLLARDRLGKKPLFYANLGNVLHFGSEIKAFYASPLWNGSYDLASLEQYFSLGYFVAPNTVYRHVRKLEPGHWLRLADGQIETRKYWDVSEFDSDTRPEAEVLEDLESLLGEAVRDRLESEVPLGAFLSGGIDSGLVVSFMSEAATRDVITVCVGFNAEEHNELEPARATARHCRSTHYEHVISPNLGEVLDPIVRAFDEPFADVSAIPTWYLSKMTREHVTVALSGDGGDETFAGYDFRYAPHAVEASVRRWIELARVGPLASLLGAHWPRSSRVPRPFRLGTVLENLSMGAVDAYYADLCFLKPRDVGRLLGSTHATSPRESAVYDLVTAPYLRCSSRSAVQRAQYADLKVYMPNDPLVKVDRMSMQHALEVRCPLLDRRVVEFAFRLPTERKMSILEGKRLLRRLADKRLPPSVARRGKTGFSAPASAWLSTDYASAFASDVFGGQSTIQSVVDISQLQRLHREHLRGSRDHSHALWASWVFERWARQQGRKIETTVDRR